MDIKGIKSNARQIFKANYWRCVLVAFLLSLLTAGTTASTGKTVRDAGSSQTGQEITDAVNALSPDELSVLAGVVFGAITTIFIISFLLRVFVFNPLKVGGYRFFKRNARERGVPAGVVAEGFGGYGHTFVTLLLQDILIALWSLLLVIPGFIKMYSYMLVPYLIKDNPELSATETITRSKELMKGHKWEAFVLDLSFIGWYLLGFLTMNLVNYFWTNPYHESARARFYLDILNE